MSKTGKSIGQVGNDLAKWSRNLGQGRITFKSVFAALLFAAIALVFVFFGFPSKMANQGATGYAARVNNAFVSLSELQKQYEQLDRMYEQLLGGRGSKDAQRQFVMGQAMEMLIDQEVTRQGAESARIFVSDKEVRDFIIYEMPIFQENNRFSKEKYLGLLAANQIIPAEFESSVRKQRSNERFRDLFEKATASLSLENERLKDLQKKQQRLQYARFTTDQVLKSMNVIDSDVSKALAQPEFMQRVQADFQAFGKEYAKPEQIRVQHLLLTATPETQKQVMEKAKELKKQSASVDFAELAKKHSQDFNAQKTGGELGWIAHGTMPAAFDAAAFAMPINTVSDPVVTESGVHLIRVLEKKPAIPAEISQVQNQIARKLLGRDRVEGQLKELQTHLQKGDSKAVDAWLKEQKLNLETTDWFDATVDMVPGVQSTEVFSVLSEMNPQKPWAPRLVNEFGQNILVKLQDQRDRPSAEVLEKEKVAAKKKGDKASPMPTPRMNEANRSRSLDVFRDWVQAEKKTALIERNSNFLRQ